MSETDSENDYESADEDHERNVSRSTSHASKKAVCLETNSCEPDNVSTLITDVSIKDEGEEKEVTSAQSNDTKLIDSQNNNKSADNTENQEVNVQTVVQSDKSCDNVSDAVSKLEKNSNSVIDVQPKRVTLRLEKKMQQKTQTVMNNNVVKNEDPKPLEEKSALSSWGFSSWGSSLLSSAASSVSTFTSQVSQGIETVLETVESSLGAPPPEDLAAVLKERRETQGDSEEPTLAKDTNSPECEKNSNPEDGDEDDGDIPSTSSLFTGVSSLKSVIESTGSKVLMGGLDTLELIGKKTIDMLTEGDPGLRKKRSAFNQGINLSQLLREAKEKAEQDQANTSLVSQEENVHFSSFFDEFQGLIHLEALEMLSSQCQNKVQGALVMTTRETSVKDELDHIKRICEDLPSADDTPDDEMQDFNECVEEHLKELQLPVDVGKITNVCKSVHDWLDTCIAVQDSGQVKDAKELYQHAIKCLAEFTAKCVEQFHKCGELILVHADPDFNTLTCATHLTGLASIFCIEVGIIAAKFSQCLNTAADDSEDPDSVTPLITTVFLEASNSTTYIQDAFQLLVPVLQAALLQ